MDVADQPDANNKPKRSRNKRGIFLLVFVVLFLTAAALAIGISLHFYLKDDDQVVPSITNPPPPVAARLSVDCHPDKNPTENSCRHRGCVWRASNHVKCSFPENYGYTLLGDPQPTRNGLTLTLNRTQAPSLYGMQPYQTLTLMVEFHTDKRLRVKIYPKGESRFEIPDEAINIPSPSQAVSESTRLYNVTFTSEPTFGFAVRRLSSNTTIFNTSLPGLAFYPQFLQISALVPNDYIYGFGEHRHERFRHDMNYRKWSIFTRDAGPDSNWNLYGAQPLYLNVEDDGKANIVFLKNSNAMEVYLQPDPSITFTTIGGVLDFYFFLGDSPNDAVSIYTEAVGRPVLPPYWALGYQLSRWGYLNISDMQMVIDRNRGLVPYDVQWADIDSLYKKYVFTYDRDLWHGMPALVKDLHAHNQKFVIIVDPGVGADASIIAEAQLANQSGSGYNMFHDGEANGIFVKAANGSTLIAEVWPGRTAYPDYTNSSVLPWFEQYVRFYREHENITVDALWIDMNEPSSFVPGSVDGCLNTTWDYPPYVPNILGAGDVGRMYEKTICMTSQHAWGRHYDVHSLYGHAMAMRTNQVLRKTFPGKRPWTMTRSSFAGTGHYATKWMGDNNAKWEQMHFSIIGIIEFSIFGFAMNGADICGFWLEPTYELCVRWHQLGAFYPFARNHNGRGDDPVVFRHQDPGAWNQTFVDIIRQPLLTRYKLLPYLYSCLFSAHLHGHTVMQSLLFQFPTDLTARDVDRQFMLGPALLISPVITPNTTEIDAYFPDARWFEYFTGTEVASRRQTSKLVTPLNKFNLHLRGGHVIPWQTPAYTTHESRMKPMGLLVVLDDEWRAQGELYLDDGETNETATLYSYIKFKMEKAGDLQIVPEKTDYKYNSGAPKFETVEVYGLNTLPEEVTVDGVAVPSVHWQLVHNIVKITNLSLSILDYHNITWSVY